MFSFRKDRFVTESFHSSWGASSTSQSLQELLLSDKVVGGNNCFHSKSSVINAHFSNKNGSSYDILNYSCSWMVDYYSGYGLPSLRKAISAGLSSLNWEKLPSSSEFGLIQFFAELDDSIAIFTKKFWQELSYGSFTWGVIPFVSDLKALLKTIRNLSLGTQNISYEDQYEFPIYVTDINLSGFQIDVLSGSCKTHKSGVCDLLAFASEAQLWLDRLGFHPDLDTAWDLVPLSFVVDWVLPVGDFISSIHQRGWVQHVLFRGWISWHFVGHYVFTTTSSHPSAQPGQTQGFELEIYERWRSEAILQVSAESRDIELLKLPSLIELFNIFYIFVASKHTSL